MTRTCSDCPGTIGKYSKTGRCKACAMRIMHADPEYAARRDAATRKMNRTPEIRAKRSAVLKERYSDPAARKAMSEAALKQLAENPELAARRRELGAASFRAFHARGGYDWSAHHRARVDKRLSWCPADRLAEYQKLRSEYGATEARRMDVAAQAIRQGGDDRDLRIRRRRQEHLHVHANLRVAGERRPLLRYAEGQHLSGRVGAAAC